MRITQWRICRLATAPAARPISRRGGRSTIAPMVALTTRPMMAGAEMNSEAMQKPIADERADDANRRVADKTKPVAADNLAGQPSGNHPNDQNGKQPLV